MLNVCARVTDDMRRQAADKIGRGIGKTETPAENSRTTANRAMTDRKALRGKRRYWSSGFPGRIGEGRWAGRYTVKWPDGRKETRSVCAGTEEECEKLPAVPAAEMKAEAAAEKERLRAENKAG